jgi:hypothetical protein
VEPAMQAEQMLDEAVARAEKAEQERNDALQQLDDARQQAQAAEVCGKVSFSIFPSFYHSFSFLNEKSLKPVFKC